MLVATLISNPANPAISVDLAHAACVALGTDNFEWLAEHIACDFLVPPSIFHTASDVETMLRSTLVPGAYDIAVQPVEGRRKCALIADMDSTMIGQECIDELADQAGIKPQVAAITARAMNGEIEFEAALRERVGLLAGMDVSVIDQTLEQAITLTPGGKELLTTMRADGAYCALVSGGFTHFTSAIAARLGFHENRANQLLEDSGKLTGKVAEPILGRQAKVDALNDIASTRNLSASDFMAVGDGANDLGMLELAGSGVALHAKPIVAEQARFRIDHGDLTALLYLQGYRQDEFVT